MHYSKYFPVDVVNGEGTRCTLFVSGCVHQCRGCYNQSTWSLTAGQLFTEELEQQIIDDLNDQRIVKQGLTLSGGDPLHPANLETVLKLVKRVKQSCHGKTIWVWTGYVLDELTAEQRLILPWIDVLIDGKYDQDKADLSLSWRGSSNQVIHYL